jgi:CPA1 family monovalent cation:H+ antiporter
MDIDHQILLIEEIVIALLFVAVLVGIAAHRLRVPYTVGLVLMGLMMTLWEKVDILIAPNLILALLVPPLIFEAAFHLNLGDLRRNLVPILLLAIPGVLLTTLIVGGIVSWGTGLPMTIAIVFGALVSATDPVSVVALFRSMGVPKRLQVLLEGESLFNDGTAIVVFNLAAAIAVSGAGQFNLVTSVVEFIRIAGGGLLVGLILGAVVSQMISRIDDHLIETALTTVLAYGAFLVAEAVGVSGVLAVVAAGLINGNIGPKGMSPTTKIVVYNFWENAGFLANSFIFLLIGLQIHLPVLFQNWYSIAWAILGILAARAISIYGLAWFERGLPLKGRHVLFWSGLRGAISLALALSLPELLPENSSQLQSMAFGVVLFTLIIQGFSMKPLVTRLKLSERKASQDEYERRHARAVASRQAYEHLKRHHSQGLLSDHSWKLISPLLQEHNRSLADAVRDIVSAHPHVEAEELGTLRREYLRAQRSAINSLRRDGTITDENYMQLIAEIDAAITNPRASWPDLLGSAAIPDVHFNRLMAVVIQDQDVENTLSALNKLGVAATRLPSTGGFFGRSNATLLIGLGEGQEELVVKALQKSCRKRVEYLATPIEGFPQGLAEPVAVTIGGATIFIFEVERFEIF